MAALHRVCFSMVQQRESKRPLVFWILTRSVVVAHHRRLDLGLDPGPSLDHQDGRHFPLRDSSYWKFKRMQNHIRWIEHSSKCTISSCQPYCSHIKNTLEHLCECNHPETCKTCQYTRSLCGFHSLRCTNTHCRVPFCMNAKYKRSVKHRHAKKPLSGRPLIRPLTTSATTAPAIEEETVVAVEEELYVSPASALKDAIRQLGALSLDVDATANKPSTAQIRDPEIVEVAKDERGVEMLKVVQNLIDAMSVLLNPEQQQDMALKFLKLIPVHMIGVLKDAKKDLANLPADREDFFANDD